MKVEKISIDKLQLNQDNTRIHGEVQIKEFRKSIEQFGIIRPIVVDENFVILCGNGLYLALKSMDYKEVDVIVMKGLTENQKKKLLLSDNKIYNLGVDDYDAIDKIMKDLQGDFDIPGYNAEDLDALYGNSSLQTDAAQDYSIPVVQPVSVPLPKQRESTPVYTESTATAQPVYGEQTTPNNEASPEMEKYIVCPHCGQRIKL